MSDLKEKNRLIAERLKGDYGIATFGMRVQGIRPKVDEEQAEQPLV